MSIFRRLQHGKAWFKSNNPLNCLLSLLKEINKVETFHGMELIWAKITVTALFCISEITVYQTWKEVVITCFNKPTYSAAHRGSKPSIYHAYLSKITDFCNRKYLSLGQRSMLKCNRVIAIIGLCIFLLVKKKIRQILNFWDWTSLIINLMSCYSLLVYV